jgi:hypothetical protein
MRVGACDFLCMIRRTHAQKGEAVTTWCVILELPLNSGLLGSQNTGSVKIRLGAVSASRYGQ